MRFNFKLKLTSLKLEDVATETARTVHKLLGENNEWHNLERKPFTCSFIKGGKLKERVIHFNNDAHLYINTEDEKVISKLTNHVGIEFDIETPKIFKSYNLLNVSQVIFNTSGKKIWVNEENKSKFIEYCKNKYGIDFEILNIRNSTVSYKNGSKLPVSDLFIKSFSDKNVLNLFESGIGGSCSLGFGFVETVKQKQKQK